MTKQQEMMHDSMVTLRINSTTDAAKKREFTKEYLNWDLTDFRTYEELSDIERAFIVRF